MSKKKVAGIERPYTPKTLGELLCDYLVQGGFDEKLALDYFSPSYDDEREIKSECFDMYSITDFGSNEGIYTSFYIEYDGEKRIRIMTAKTLSTDKESYVKMHEMAANVCFSFHKFAERNLNRFIWSGYNVSFKLGKTEHNYVWCYSMERVGINANEIRKKYPKAKVYYVDCYTRKKYKYNF